ncbi:BAG family molecular chaperone regulator 8, chloroplastic [Typha latifolia]|uniref:BAG family molecular chaperone regulator 8, chloroplastic n=1 Tax=Typha latifolia TaxID=4733 RepID=UPI003C2E19E3
MSSSYHHHHPNHNSRCPSSPPSCCNCCCASSIPPPPNPSSDQLLQYLATHLLLQSTSQPLPAPPPPGPPPLYSYHYLKKTQQANLPKDHHAHLPEDHQLLLNSLIRRVAALESNLLHLASPSPNPPSYSPPPPPPPSLRDLAARTIQTWFRRFLVRRSQTLRHLKALAAIKSHVAVVKSSLSGKTHLDPKAISEKAMDLLIQVDSIQSGEPMIREGKRSISRELVRIMEFVDKVLVKEQEISLRAMEIAGNAAAFGDDEVFRSTKAAKKVSFLENGRRHMDSITAHMPFPEEGNDYLQPSGFHQLSDDDEKSSESSSETDRKGGKRSGLSAPLPVQMEPRKSASPRR